MQLSTKARYATRAMIELALEFGTNPLQLKEIARRQDISEKYLEQVLLPLRTRGFIYTLKGSKGGYCLAVTPQDVTLYDIIQTVEGSIAPVHCVENKEICARIDKCAMRNYWSRLKDKITEELQKTTLADLAQEQKEKEGEVGEKLDYQI